MPDQSYLSLSRVSTRLLSCLATVSLFLVTALPLHAHHLPPGMEDVDEFEDGAAFMAGLRHPLLGFDHWMLAAVVGVLVVAGVRRSSKGLLLPLLGGVAIGAMLGVNAVVLPGVSMSFVFALVVPLVLLTQRGKLPKSVQSGLIAFAALWQGNIHGLAWPLEAATGSYILGLMAMTAVLAFCGGIVAKAAQSSALVASLSFTKSSH